MSLSGNDDIIKRLPESVANCIAAGEVIQRPASVIKELVENSVDAGASSVKIILKDAGKTLIQVIDDGCGMSPADARLAFEKHATSKIRKAEDMFALHTMGFRGEALPSVAAVAEVEMRTMRPGDEIGTKVTLTPGELTISEPCVCTQGTNILVKRLFYNFVARRRFLGKDQTELSHIMHEFERLALVNTDLKLEIMHNGSVLHQLPKAPLKQRIGALFGKSVENQLIPIDTTTNLVKITGYIGVPSSARRRGALQFFFVNGRNMKHRYFHSAVLNCYKELIAGDAKPNFFINFDIDPSRIDVNVHPQKHEIKFEDEQLIWQILTAAVRESLHKSNVGPAIDFDASDVPDIPPCRPDALPPDAPVSNQFDPDYTPFMSGPEGLPPNTGRLFKPAEYTRHTSSIGSSLNNNWAKLYETFSKPTSGENEQLSPNTIQTPELFDSDHKTTTGADTPLNGNAIQIQGHYIVSDHPEGMMVIDQYRAHVAILFNTYSTQIADGNVSSQHLIFPETIELPPTLAALLSEMADEFRSIGFEISRDSTTDNMWSINAIPAALNPTQAAATIKDLLTAANDQDTDAINNLHRRAALSLARSVALRGRTTLTHDEIDKLLSDLMSLPSHNMTPDGLPIIYIISSSELSAYFSR